MADYCETARSNYFAVKNKKKFEAFCAKYGLDHWPSGESKRPLYAFSNRDDGTIGDEFYNPESGEHEYGDFAGDLAKCLSKDAVAIWMGVGNEKLRYVSGFATAVNSRGDVKQVYLTDIYAMVKDLTTKPKLVTECSY